MSLSDGPEMFIREARGATNQNDNRRSGDLVRGVAVCFTDFVWMMYKFTERCMNKVQIEGWIEPMEGGGHALILSGIRDVAMRDQGYDHATCLPGHQRGQWACILEDALEYGISAEEIEQLRHSLHLRPDDGVLDDEFFRKDLGIPI